MNIASNGNVAPTIAGAKTPTKTGTDSDSDGQEEEEGSVSDTTSIDHTSRVDMTENEKGGEGPFSYVGSSSGIYLLSRLFPKDGNRHEESDPIPRPVDGHEEDLMIANYNSRSSWHSPNFMPHAAPDWKIPPKEITDYLTDM